MRIEGFHGGTPRCGAWGGERWGGTWDTARPGRVLLKIRLAGGPPPPPRVRGAGCCAIRRARRGHPASFVYGACRGGHEGGAPSPGAASAGPPVGTSSPGREVFPPAHCSGGAPSANGPAPGRGAVPPRRAPCAPGKEGTLLYIYEYNHYVKINKRICIYPAASFPSHNVEIYGVKIFPGGPPHDSSSGRISWAGLSRVVLPPSFP